MKCAYEATMGLLMVFMQNAVSVLQNDMLGSFAEGKTDEAMVKKAAMDSLTASISALSLTYHLHQTTVHRLEEGHEAESAEHTEGLVQAVSESIDAYLRRPQDGESSGPIN